MFVVHRFALFFCLFFVSAVHAIDAGSLEIRVVPAITDNYILDDYQPADTDQPAAIRLVAAPDEYEPASFVVFANEQIDNLQLTASDLIGPTGASLTGASIDIRIVKRWYQRIFAANSDPADMRLRHLTPELLVYDDDLIKIEGKDNYLRMESGEYRKISEPGKIQTFKNPKPEDFPVRDARELQPLTINEGGNRQFWVTLHLPPDAQAGIYSADITLRQGERFLATIPLTVEVLPFDLDAAQINYSFYYRGKLDKDWPNGSVSSEYKSKAQLLSDYQNLAAHGISNPIIYQYFSTGFLDEVFSLREQAGLDNSRIFYMGLPEAAGTDGRVSPWLAGNVKGVLELARDYGAEDVYFYAKDEARDEMLVMQYPYWDVIKQAGGKVMAAGWQSHGRQAGNFEITGGREDLFVSLGALRLEEARNWHGKGRLIYSYQNPTGGWEIPETWRRNYGLLLWQYEYDGGSPYAWQHSYGNVWNDFDSNQYKDHNFTYPTLDGQIDTVQWEGLREGVDDVRYLSTLVNALAEVAKDDQPSAIEARAWLRELKDRPLGQSDLSKIRAEMVAHIIALKGLEPVALPGSIEGLQVAPIEPDGRTSVTWQTPGRTPAYLEVDQAGEKIETSSQGLAIYHELAATAKPNEKLPFVAYSYFDEEGAPIRHAGVIDATTAISLATSPAQRNGELEVDVELESNYRSSIGVDWQQSLLGWWRFSSAESPGDDDSSWNNEAKLKGDAESGAGWFGKGVVLDGAGAFVNMPDIDIPENGTATIEGWFRFRSFAMDNRINMSVFSWFYQHAYNNNFYLYGNDGSFQVGSLLHLNTWHHIALSWDGDEATAVVYVDGQRVPITVRGDVDDINRVDGLNIGRSTGYLGGIVGAATNTFDGDIDEIRVWNRVLSEAEIQASYNAHKSRKLFLFPLEGETTPEFSLIGANAADQLAGE